MTANGTQTEQMGRERLFSCGQIGIDTDAEWMDGVDEMHGLNVWMKWRSRMERVMIL